MNEYRIKYNHIAANGVKQTLFRTINAESIRVALTAFEFAALDYVTLEALAGRGNQKIIATGIEFLSGEGPDSYPAQ